MTTSQMANTKDIISKSISKDDFEKELEELYKSEYISLFRYVFSRIERKEDASDIVSLAFLKALQSRDKFKMLHSRALISWIYKIATNEILLFYRRKKVERKYFIEKKFLMKAMDEIYEQPSSVGLLIESLDNLSNKEIDLIQMKYFDYLSFKQMAVIVGKSEESLRVSLHRIRKKLNADILQLSKRKGIEVLLSVAILIFTYCFV